MTKESEMVEEISTLTDAAEDKTAAQQTIRIKRLLMSCGSYTLTFALILFCWWQKMVPGRVVVHFLIASVLLNGIFFALIKSNFNLRFTEPSLTLAQIVTSIIPPLYVMYFLDAGQARSVFLYLLIVPALYGILALNTRQFMIVAIWDVLVYGLVIGLLALNRPETLVVNLELIQLVALIVVVAQMALIGGYINNLRFKLRERNEILKDTTEQLNTAVEHVGELARRDELTGLYNRRHLFSILEHESSRMSRKQGTFSICIADIDYFKQVNDTHGHQAGDEVLRQVASELQQSLRSIDCIGRYGGEEFLIVLPQTELEGAMIKSERIRKLIADLTFPSIGDKFKVTVSFGVAEHKPNESIDETILRSDEALYRAKNSGRNKVVSEYG